MIFKLYYLNYMTYLILIPGFLISLFAQIYLKHNYRKWMRISTHKGRTAYEVARNLLNRHGCDNVEIRDIGGELTDNYNPKNKTLNLSASVSDFNSVAAVAVAAHECGHAVQDKRHSPMFVLRGILVPITNIGSYLALPLVIIGLILEYTLSNNAIMGEYIVLAGIACYSLSLVFCLVTLPVEIGASMKAKKMLLSTGEIDKSEAAGVKQVLTSAALTYVAALFVSLLYLLRFIIIIASLSNKKKK